MNRMNLIINTHWDREYRWSFRETQYRLVEAVDDLLDIMQKDPGFAYYHTDSQVSMLDDYLEMRPERAAEVKKLVSEGRILTGPWYTLPAEFLVSGESLVRNLQTGHRISKELGKTMKAAYNIFSWGQVSQLPQLYRQFGMDTIIFYRGVNQTELDTLEFRWQGADDKEALALTFGSYHRLNFWRYVYKPYILGGSKMLGDSLKNAFSREELGKAYLTQMCGESLTENNQWLNNQQFVNDLEGAWDGLQQLISTVKDKSSTDELLFFQGFDQENPDPVVPELVRKLGERLTDGSTLQIASLEDCIPRIREKLAPKYGSLPVLSGEMLSVEKNGDAFGPLYNGVFSARMPVKLANAKAEYALLNGAEPAAAFLMLMGGEYPVRMLRSAWKEVLQNQQHDGIGGCHVDRVTVAMQERYRIANDIAETIIKKSLRQLTGKIDLQELGEDEIGMVIYNTLPYDRDGMIMCMVDVPQAWKLRYANRGRREIRVTAATMDGRTIPAQLLEMEDDTVYAYLKYGDTIDFDAARCRVLLDVKDIPQNGYITLRLKAHKGEERPNTFISPRAQVLENEYLRAVINANGTLTVTDKQSGRVMENIHYFEDTSEKAGPLTHQPVYEQLRQYSLNERASVALVYNGPLQATYRITLRWMLPKRVETQLKIHVPHGSEWVDQGKLHRSDDLVELVITTDVTLHKEARALKFHTTVNNNACDHRLRVLFNTGMTSAEYCRTDSPFDVVKRPIAVPDSSGWYEAAARTWPSHSFVAVGDEGMETAVFHRGIPEYELVDDDNRAIALTLLRCFSNAGNPTEVYEYQELAECLGKWEYDYWFHVQPSPMADYKLVREALTHINPCYAMQTTRHEGDLPAPGMSFFAIDNPVFTVTSVTAEDAFGAIHIRGWNASDESQTVKLSLCRPAQQVEKVDMEGHVLETLTVDENGCFTFTAGKREIVTLRVKWEADHV